MALFVVVDRDKAAPARRSLLRDPAAVHFRYAVAGHRDDDDGAISILEERLQAHRSPLDAADLADLYVRRAVRSGYRDPSDLDTAERLARQSLDVLSHPNAARLTLARIAHARHEFQEAVDLGRQHLATRGPNAAATYVVIASACVALGDLTCAIEAANNAVATRPDRDGYLTRALVEQAMGRDAECALDFERAARAEQPGDLAGAARLRALWGRFLLRRGAFDDARTVLAEALRLVPELPLAIGQQAELALRTGRPKDAASLFERAYALSGQTRYVIDEARARELVGDTEKAMILRDRAVHLLSRDPRGHELELVEVLVDRGTPTGIAEAVRLGEAELARRPTAEVRYLLARALVRAGRLEDARAQAREALASGAREAQLFALAGYVESRLGDAAAAARHRSAANELDPLRSGWRELGIRTP